MYVTVLFPFGIQNFTFTSREEVFTMKNTFKRLQIKFLKDSLRVVKHEEESSADFSVSAGSNTGYLSAWRDGHLAIGGLLGETAALKYFSRILYYCAAAQKKDLLCVTREDDCFLHLFCLFR